MDLKFDKKKFVCKAGSYCVGKVAELSDPLLYRRAQDYKRTLSGRMRAISSSESFRIPKTRGLYVSRKYDGEFALLFFDGTTVISINPGGTVRTGLPAYEEAARLLKKSKVDSCILAAEIYVKDKPTKAHPVQQVVGILRNPSGEGQIERLGVAVFDVVEADGKALDNTSIVYQLLNKWFKDGDGIHVVEHKIANTTDEVMELFTDWVVGEGAEGLVVRHDQAGWFKIKSRHNIDTAVIGFTEGTDERKGMLHDLLIAVVRDDGTFHELGRVGGGFSDDQRREVVSRLKRRIVPSDYVAVNNDYVAYEMIRPGPVIEISCLDMIPERTKGGPVNRMVLEWDGKRYSALQRMPIVSLISPLYVRDRDDKEANKDDTNIRQISDLVEVPKADEAAIESKSAPSKVLERLVYTKTMKDNKMVRKLLLWKTNKEDQELFPAYVVYLTDFSPNRQDQLIRDVKVAQNEKAAREMFKEVARAKFVAGWKKVD